ncbi:MAG: aminoacyl-tRNA hydrolase [Candidatus Magasanikbacteria bacterium CG10_big_fil_rev_8_21_14_0_10_47_10]|uniref:Peptidyl-tRNA hydrolase n=1 Tax=Candidatus Magasanikbacteria bacterium CG10_big_fil_rev_8_21_14_0_10_47_10 TaxID=1974652 RepID=A0A2H0TPE4_9BACT|nr:MAG: aminoacyl-tRNA hydrolase [Candidatus Magasanikbacteria bacterium CG10_big_fil_rev_8_21_14_0_10_47_10]
MKLIVGLGNPGKRYEKTRHNIGFFVVDALQTAHGTTLTPWQISKKFNAQISGGMLGGQKIILAKPMTYMNRSGEAVGLIGQYYKLAPKDIIVVHDEKDLPLGELRVQTGRGDAGHNGVKSIIEHVGKDEITRIRVGIASDNMKKMKHTEKFVLGKFGILERKTVEQSVEHAMQEILALL